MDIEVRQFVCECVCVCVCVCVCLRACACVSMSEIECCRLLKQAGPFLFSIEIIAIV